MVRGSENHRAEASERGFSPEKRRVSAGRRAPRPCAGPLGRSAHNLDKFPFPVVCSLLCAGCWVWWVHALLGGSMGFGVMKKNYGKCSDFENFRSVLF